MRIKSKLRAVEAERDAWREAAVLYRQIAADGVLRLKRGLSYAQAQDVYNRALDAQPDQKGTKAEADG